MADRRKLQGEIDRCLKKVTEGVEIFDDIWQKVHSATNANQKEKYETDLKKEIKKLQRLRDQIKTWTSSSDIKDKRILQENRKLIETQMERFKVVERETKTKAYSKEGLSGAIQKTDPAQKEREEIRLWVTGSIGTLNLHIEQFESEIETLILTSKKKKLEKDKQDRVDQVRKYMEKHKFHVKQLETLLRMLDNDNIETESIRNIKDDIEYYIECSQDPDFKENEYIYEDLNLDETNEDTSLTNSTPPSTTCSSPTPSSPALNFSKSFSQEDDKVNSTSNRSRADDEFFDEGSHFTSLTTDDHVSPPTHVVRASAIALHPDHGARTIILSSPPHMTRHYPPPLLESPGSRRHPPEMQPLTGVSAVPSGPPISYAAITGHLTSSTSMANSTNHFYQPPPPSFLSPSASSRSADYGVPTDPVPLQPPSFQSSFTPLVNVSMATRVQNFVDNLNGTDNQGHAVQAAESLKSIASQIVMATGTNSPPTDAASTVYEASSPATSSKRTTEDLIQEQQSRRLCILKRLLQDQQGNGPSSNASSEINSYIDNLKGILSSSDCPPEVGGTDPIPLSHTHVIQPIVTADSVYDVAGGDPPRPDPKPIQAPVTDNKKFIEEVLSRMVVSGHGVEQALKANTTAPEGGLALPTQPHTLTFERGGTGPTGEAMVTPLLGASPLGPIALGVKEAWRAQVVDRVYGSEAALPKCMDAEKTRWLLTRTPYATPAYYNNPSYTSDSPDFYQRLSTETLFFVFYYFEGSKAQYMAAKALKKLSWRFHTKYLMWFQRHEEPKTITDEFEQGTYIYFDYEKWSQRRKEGFTFEYKFLEDRDLS